MFTILETELGQLLEYLHNNLFEKTMGNHCMLTYFMKLKNYNGDYDQLWENHLEGLLFEYLRGMTEIPTKLKVLAERI